MMSAIAMTRRKSGRKGVFLRVAGILRVAGHCVVILAAVALAGCEYLAEMGAGESGQARSGGRSARSVQPDKAVREVQTLLAEQGYDPGPADGLLGNRTVQAIREYQKAAGLPVDGKISAQLMKSLKSGTYNRQKIRAAPATIAGSADGTAAIAKRSVPLNGIFTAEFGGHVRPTKAASPETPFGPGSRWSPFGPESP